MTTNTTKKQKPRQPTPRQPLRRCVGCGEMIDKRTLIRIARNKDGDINIDPSSKMQGRAAYLCKSAACLQKAKKTKGLERSYKTSVPPETYMQLAEHLEDFL